MLCHLSRPADRWSEVPAVWMKGWAFPFVLGGYGFLKIGRRLKRLQAAPKGLRLVERIGGSTYSDEIVTRPLLPGEADIS
jgi:hypothetical protein